MEWANNLPGWAQMLATLLVALAVAAKSYIDGRKAKLATASPDLGGEMDKRVEVVQRTVLNESADIKREVEDVGEDVRKVGGALDAHDRRTREEIERVQRLVKDK